MHHTNIEEAEGIQAVNTKQIYHYKYINIISISILTTDKIGNIMTKDEHSAESEAYQ